MTQTFRDKNVLFTIQWTKLKEAMNVKHKNINLLCRKSSNKRRGVCRLFK